MKMLPQSIDAEQGLIGSILLKPDDILPEIAAQLLPEHFHVPANGTIYNALVELWKASKPIDAIILTQTLADNGLLERVGGAVYVTTLYSYTPTAANWRQYVEIVFEKYTLRQVMVVCSEFSAKAQTEPENVANIISEMAGRLASIRMGSEDKRQTLKELVVDKFDRIEGRKDDADKIVMDIPLLDKHSPLSLGAFPIIAAEAKAGKSILATQIGLNVAKGHNGVIYFSLEEPARKVVDRLFKNEASIPQERQFIGQGGMTEADFTRASKAGATLASLDFTIVDDIHDLTGIVAFIKKAKAQNPNLKLVVVDYLQLVRGDSRKNGNREQEIAGISRTLRLLGIELHIAIVALSQLNTDGATRESKAIENDCTALWKICRSYEQTSRGQEPVEESGRRIITIPFQREGDSNVAFPVAFIGALARIAEAANNNE